MPNSKPKRVIFVSTDIGGGGAERVLATLLKHLDRDKYEPYLVLFQDTINYPIPADVTLLILNKKGLYDFPRLVWRLAKTMRTLKPDVAISFLRYTNIISTLAKIFSFSKFRLILTEHGVPSYSLINGPNLPNKIFSQWLPRLLYPVSDKVVCVSKKVACDVEAIYKVPKVKIRIIHNPIDISKIILQATEPAEHPFFSSGLPIIISVGRLTHIKGHKDLLKAFSIVVNHTPSLLMVIGQGEDKKKLQQLAITLGIENQVTFLGFQDNPFKYLAQSSIFVLPSLTEAFPVSLLEAMCVDLPVIATRTTGASEIIHHGYTGMLVPIGSPDLLAGTIKFLLDDKEFALELSLKGKQFVRVFDAENIIKEYEGLIEAQ